MLSKICRHDRCDNPVKGRGLQCNACKESTWKYGLTRPAAQDLLDAQGGCKICGTDVVFSGKVGATTGQAVIDHCHNSGKVRGILCGSCNVGLGKFKDDTIILEKAIDYIKSSL